MLPDIEKYRPYFDEYDLSEEEKEEYIRTLWRFMERFVDQAFDPEQLSRKESGDRPASEDDSRSDTNPELTEPDVTQLETLLEEYGFSEGFGRSSNDSKDQARTAFSPFYYRKS